ncbi:hypothetical protein [Campylobacter concisus]|nr:hypothetical protein [Campylobacter concisus]
MARQRITCHKKVGDFLKNNLDVEFYFIDRESVEEHGRTNELKI